MNIFQNDPGLLQSNFCRRGPSRIALSIFLALIGHPAFSATISYVGTEPGTGASGYAAQNWSNSGVNKEYDLSGNVYGTAGYYMIRPRLNSSPGDQIYQGALAGNNLGITATNSPTLYSKPGFINTMTGGAGDYVNFNSYPLIRGPDGSELYLAGGLSVPVNVGPYNPEGISNAFFGEAFSFTTGVAATFRLAVAVDSVSDGTYAPNYVGLYNNGVGTKLSSALTKDGTMDMAVFDVEAAAGDTFSAAMWQSSGTQSAAAYSLVTFDVSSYNFNVANGASQTNTAVLNGAPAKLLKTGDGVLIVTNANTYGGGTTVSAGTLELGDGGSVIGNITNNATLSINRNDTNTLANAISGSGSLSKAGVGTAILTNANTYSGSTTINGGRLLVAHGDALGSTAGGTTVASGAQLMLSNVVVGNEAVTINGDGLASGPQFAGSLRSIGTNTLGGKVTLGSDAKIFGGSGTSLTLDVTSGDAVNLASYNLTIDGAGASRIKDGIVGTGRLTKEGSGTLTLEGANTYTGGTTISAGTLKLQGGSMAGNITNNANLTITGGTELVNTISGSGSLTKADSGLSILWSANSYMGATVVEAGSLRLDGSGSLSSSTTLQVASGAEFSATGIFKLSNDLTVAGLTGAGNVYNKAGNITVNKSLGTNEFSGVISGATGLTKAGAGNLRLSGINTYSNSTTVNAGVLEVASGGSIASSETTVNSSGTLDVDGTAGAVMVNNGGILMGSGTVSALTIASGGTLAVGNSPGTLTASSATWNGGGKYAWEINNFLGNAGTNWDFLNITGGLTINASSGNKFIIDVISLLASSNTTGDASNFNPLSNYSFAIATAAGGITGFDASYFDVQTTKFSNVMNPGSGWYLTQSGSSINLNYAAAIPEPSTTSLALAGFGVLALMKRRRKIQTKV